ncbi:MAG: mechanosensitive ion channel family protein [Clostridia bacterium]|nr:mechanosensitive ion channel family protein [Clostridia bacterium]
MIFENIRELIGNLDLGKTVSELLITTANIAVIALICLLVCAVILIVTKIISASAKRKSFKTITQSAKNNHFTFYLCLFFISVTVSSFASAFPRNEGRILKITSVLMILILMLLVNSIIDIIGDLYSTKSISKKRPIKGLLQIIKVLVIIVLTIIMVSLLINQSPLVLIGGIGTFTAIISIVFKDALLGLVAGVQITSDDLLRIGDWVEIPSENVEGTVQDISLISVKILAFDNTLYTIPAYTFLSVPFRNWHTALKSKARRVFRAMPLDIDSIKPCEDVSSVLKKYEEFSDLKEALDKRSEKTGELTNLSVFLELLPRIIKKDPNVVQDKLVICQVNDTKSTTGVPVEFFFFTDLTDWEHYSMISSSKAELALALAKELGLKPYQSKVSVNAPK